MPTQHCQCGAKYRFPDSSIGKRAKCKKCGSVLTLADEDENSPIPLADDGFMDEAAVAAEQARSATSTHENGAESPHAGLPVSAAYLPSSESVGRLGTLVVEQDGVPPSYTSDLLRTFLFPSSAGNLVTFFFVWGMLFVASALLPAAGLVGLAGRFIIVGWFCAYRFNVIVEAAAGERDLPAFALTEGAFDGIFLPLFRWLGSWLVVLAPAYTYAVVMLVLGWPASIIPAAPMSSGIAGMVQDAEAIAMLALLLLGLFAWPMVVLCVALGGFPALARVDLIVVTVFKSFPVYLLTVLIVCGTDLASGFLTNQVPGGMVSSYFAAHALVSGFHAYFEIVAMRVIGLYYHHFKDRFAWSWE